MGTNLEPSITKPAGTTELGGFQPRLGPTAFSGTVAPGTPNPLSGFQPRPGMEERADGNPVNTHTAPSPPQGGTQGKFGQGGRDPRFDNSRISALPGPGMPGSGGSSGKTGTRSPTRVETGGQATAPPTQQLAETADNRR